MRFQPLSFSWVAIHPQPKGVIQFMGGAFFGSFPTVFYRHFLQSLFDAGYTIVALPSRFSFQHWSIALDLLKEQIALRQLLTESTGNVSYQEPERYLWIGHSLGCKYIALLELLSGEAWQQHAAFCLPQPNDAIWAKRAELTKVSILNQPALLIAPDISDTESAIPIPAVARWLDRVKLGVVPTRSQTQCLIERSALFNLTALISFNQDRVAGSAADASQDAKTQASSDVLWLMRQLSKRGLLTQELAGGHLAPLGLKIGGLIFGSNWLKPVRSRLLEHSALHLIEQLRQRQAKSCTAPKTSEDMLTLTEVGSSRSQS